jgi:hypothetical protein
MSEDGFAERVNSDRLNPVLATKMEELISILLDQQGGCEKILKTPLPFVYAALNRAKQVTALSGNATACVGSQDGSDGSPRGSRCFVGDAWHRRGQALRSSVRSAWTQSGLPHRRLSCEMIGMDAVELSPLSRSKIILDFGKKQILE